MSSEAKAQWLKLTVVQLKGALSMRGLETEGKKADLVDRLTEYEAKKEKEKEEAEKSTQSKDFVGCRMWLVGEVKTFVGIIYEVSSDCGLWCGNGGGWGFILLDSLCLVATQKPLSLCFRCDHISL